MLSNLKPRCFWVGIALDVEEFCKSCHECDDVKLPHAVPLHAGVRVRRRVQHGGTAKIQDIFSDEVYGVVRALTISGGQCVIR